jgi:uncharacterized damage-inducible protein DinB
MSPSLPEPGESADVAGLFLTYLDFYRAEVVRKVAGLPDAVARERRAPFGWSPLELLNHLVHMERRWFVWGFAGEAVDDPWGERDHDDRWAVGRDVGLDDLRAALDAGAERTRAIVTAAPLDQSARPGGRFGPGDPSAERHGGDGEDGGPPRLAAILFHVLQEYARHCGHLDIVRELADGLTGEDPAEAAAPAG